MPTKWQHGYRKVNGKRGRQQVLVRRNKGKEEIKVPTKEYIRKHHPRGAWDS